MNLIQLIRQAFDFGDDAVSGLNGSSSIIIEDQEFIIGMSFPSADGDASHISSGYGMHAVHARDSKSYSLFAYPDSFKNEILLISCTGRKYKSNRIALSCLSRYAVRLQLQHYIEDYIVQTILTLSHPAW